jgi:hypothetical protein
MGTKSKFFRAFVAGNTISDGRTITPEMIGEIVKNFNVATYTPRCNVEHVSGYSPEPPFNGYGSVIAVKSQIDDVEIGGKTEKRMALYCQVDGNDQLVGLADKDQKPFPSVELTDNYAGTSTIGLIGLAFTDRPASIATQALQFSRHAPGSVFGTAPEATALEFEAAPASIGDMVKSAVASAMAKFTSQPDKPKDEPKHKPANDNFDPTAFATALGDSMAATMATAMKPVTDAQTAIDARFTALETRLASTEAPNGFSRPPADGAGEGGDLTDC